MITQCNFGDGDIDIKGYRSIYAQLVMGTFLIMNDTHGCDTHGCSEWDTLLLYMYNT